MSERFEHDMNDSAGPARMVGFVGAGLAIAVGASLIWLISHGSGRDQDAARPSSVPAVDVAAVEAEQMARLTDDARVERRDENPDRGESIVIPIDEAMQHVITEARN